jgi:transcriptional regulator with GAF, ATPase, and Fis domain
VEFLKALFASNDFMPHGFCYLWNPSLIWLHVVSDSLIALAYFFVPVTLVYFIRKRRDLPFDWMFISFGVFILACGATHAMEVWTLWHANYWLSGAVKAVTALASAPTAILLVRLVPQALALPSPEALRREIADRKRAQEALETAKNELELRVQERTAELSKTNEDLVKAFQEIKTLKDQFQNENVALREEVDCASMFEEIVGTSKALQKVISSVAKVAPTDSTVLITGETGTGKELIARAIHKRSQRSGRAFVSVNCAALPASLIASELFGHEKGAFTGAQQRRLGRFELADGGTIFLDEIGELPAETQIALLRVLQEREFERVGGSQAVPVDVRVIAATNRDLKAACAAGTFRMDLFYRLNVFPIEVPPLRDRKEDLPTLVEYFIQRFANKTGKKIRNVEKRTLELLQAYQWPGNVRELQNVIERSMIVCESETFSIDRSWLLRESVQPTGPATPFFEKLVDQEKQMIEAALAASKGKVAGPSGAASKLGIPVSTLESKIKVLKINKYLFKSS